MRCGQNKKNPVKLNTGIRNTLFFFFETVKGVRGMIVYTSGMKGMEECLAILELRLRRLQEFCTLLFADD